jgi:hypothetical protein
MPDHAFACPGIPYDIQFAIDVKILGLQHVNGVAGMNTVIGQTFAGNKK